MQKKKQWCTVCCTTLPITNFYARGDVAQRICKNCYKSSQSYPLKKLKAREKNNRPLLLDAMKNGCIDCGELDIVVLDFDHIDPTTKLYKISDIRTHKDPQLLIAELKKCVVRCANCHRRRTAEQFGSWRLDAKKPSE